MRPYRFLAHNTSLCLFLEATSGHVYIAESDTASDDDTAFTSNNNTSYHTSNATGQAVRVDFSIVRVEYAFIGRRIGSHIVRVVGVHVLLIVVSERRISIHCPRRVIARRRIHRSNSHSSFLSQKEVRMSPQERAERIAQFAPHANYDFFMSNIVADIREAVADEREACAAICDRWAAFQREEIGNYKSPVTQSKIEGREDASCKLAEIIRARS